MDTLASAVQSRSPAADPLEAARHWLDTADRIALATVISTWGSSPAPIGSQLAVASDRRFEGSVSGGCVEAEVIFTAEEVMKTGRPRVLAFGVSDNVAWRSGLPCGGRIEVLIEALDAEDGRPYLDTLLAARSERRPLVVETSLTDGTRTIYGEGAPLPEYAAEAIRTGQSRVTEDKSRFVHARVPAVHLIIIGATHIAQVLSDLARRIGWCVSVIDPRSAFLTGERFGRDVARSTEWPEESLAAMTLDSSTAVVALTHMGHIDDESLIAALRSPCFYVGALGSRRTHAARMGRLKAAGLSDDELSRIRAPIGLKIGAQGPAEIALSILSEIVKELRGA